MAISMGRLKSGVWKWLLFGGALLSAGLIGVLIWGMPPTPAQGTAPPAATLPPGRAATAAEVEERLGIRVRFIGVTAAGGLVELRYEVVDAEKAAGLLDMAGRPALVAEDSGTVLTMHVRPEVKSLDAGRSYSFLFANTRSAIRPGTLVTVALGDLRLEHLRAQ